VVCWYMNTTIVRKRNSNEERT